MHETTIARFLAGEATAAELDGDGRKRLPQIGRQRARDQQHAHRGDIDGARFALRAENNCIAAGGVTDVTNKNVWGRSG